MGEAGIEMAELGESAENGLETSNEFGDASDLNDNLNEAKEGIRKNRPRKNPEIKKIKEDVDRQLSENAAELNEKAKNYQNSEGRFHEKLSKTVKETNWYGNIQK